MVNFHCGRTDLEKRTLRSLKVWHYMVSRSTVSSNSYVKTGQVQNDILYITHTRSFNITTAESGVHTGKDLGYPLRIFTTKMTFQQQFLHNNNSSSKKQLTKTSMSVFWFEDVENFTGQHMLTKVLLLQYSLN